MAEGNVSSASNGVENLTAQLRVLKKELATLDPNSSKFQELALQAGEVKDRINDASEAMNANAGSAFERLGNNASLLKDRLLNMDLEGVTSSIKGFAGQISGLSFKGVVDGVKGLGGALKALGTALLTNPIFLLVAALVAIGGAIKMILDDQRNDVDAANKAIDKSNEQRHNVERLRMAEAQGNEKALADLKKKSMQEDLKDTKAKIDNLMWMESQAYGLSEEQAKELDSLRSKYAQQRVDYEIYAVNEIANLNRMILENEKTVYQSKLSAREIELQNLDEWFVKQLNMAGDNERALEAANDAYLVKRNQINDKYNKEDAAKSKAAREKTKADNKAAADDGLAARQAYAQANMDAQENETYALQQEQIKQLADFKGSKEERLLLVESFALREQQIMDKYDQLAADADAAAEVALNAARLKQQEDYYKVSEFLITDAKEKEISALVAAYEEQYELANGNAEKEKELAEKQKKDIADIEDKYRKEKEDKDKDEAQKKKDDLATELELHQKKVQMASDALGSLMALNDAFNSGNEKSAKKAFQINKALSLAQAIMNTYKGVTAVLGDPTLVGPARFIAAGTVLANGLANVAKIAKTQFKSTSDGGGGGGNGGGGGSLGSGGGGGSMTSVTPSFNPLNTSFLNNRPAQTGAVQAYVLSSNVSSAMEANQKVKDQTVL